MVGRDVHQHGDVGFEVVHAVELETTELQHIDIVFLRGHLHGVALPDVAAQTYVQACVLQEIVDERGGRGLAVAAGDADFLRRVVVAGELDLGNDGRALFVEFDHQWRGLRDTGALDHEVCSEDTVGAVAAFLEGDVPFLQFAAEVLFQGTAVRQEGVEVLDFGQYRCAYAAFAAAENDCFFHVYRIFKVTMVMTARMMEMIQNRTTILFSGWMRCGVWIRASGFSFW